MGRKTLRKLVPAAQPAALIHGCGPRRLCQSASLSQQARLWKNCFMRLWASSFTAEGQGTEEKVRTRVWAAPPPSAQCPLALAQHPHRSFQERAAEPANVRGGGQSP